MKKNIFLIILMILIFFFTVLKVNSLGSININKVLDKNQIGITFINDRELLIYLNEKKLKLVITNSDYKIMDKKNKEINDVKDLNIYNDNNRIIINYQNNNLCILNDNYFNDCQYIYLIGNNNIGEIPSNIQLVIYGLNVKETTILNNYNNWIDTHELKKNYYTTLIWDNNHYQLLRILKKEYQVLN